MKRIFIFLPLLLLLPVLALGQDRFNEVGAVYGAIRSMTPEAYKEAHDKYGIRWIEAWTGNLTGGTEEQYDAWIERFNTAMTDPFSEIADPRHFLPDTHTFSSVE